MMPTVIVAEEASKKFQYKKTNFEVTKEYPERITASDQEEVSLYTEN